MGAGSVAAAFGPGNAVIGAIHGGFVFFLDILGMPSYPANVQIRMSW